MRLTRWNGEYWYHDDRPILGRIAGWFVWVGGWKTHSPKASWSVGKWPLWKRLTPDMLSPVSFLGHRVTYYGWGWQWRVKGAYWVYARRPRMEGRRLYRSHNGTPSEAHIWLIGAPRDVQQAADDQMGERKQRAERRRAEIAAIHIGHRVDTFRTPDE